MFKKYGRLGVLLLPAVMFVIWVGVLSFQRGNGREVVVRISGYDPRDLLAGHYINYQIDWSNTDCKQFEDSICPKKDFQLLARNWFRPSLYRFYIAEKYADTLEKEINNVKNEAEIVYSYQKGRKPYALRLLINGQSYEANTSYSR